MRAKALTVFLMLTLCFLNALPAAEPEGDVLYVYTWAEYFDKQAVRLFEEQYGCRVDFTYYDSNETMIESMRSGSGYDIMTPTPGAALLFAKLGVIRKLDRSLLPNIGRIDAQSPSLLDDPEMTYSVPYTVAVTGVGYNKTLVPPESVGTWKIFGDARLAGKMAMLSEIREVLGAALKYLGYSLNSVNPGEVRAAGLTVAQWKKNLASFGVSMGKQGLREGTFAAIHAYNGDIAPLIEENPDIAFFIPKEGAALNSDGFVIASDAPSPRLAHAFINHFLDPKIAAMNMEGTYFYMPNPDALELVSRRIKDNPAFAVPPEVLSRCEMMRAISEEGMEMHEDAWSKAILFQ